ncbi:hypothetical protein LWI29_035303 [Acer saccharum]|uniref:Uncharacterized protein n=1 Tax=Acer saccharum TaxID=4024 RepID=A0AA39S1U1_ACESA|nr:hypothetical protein LWI29_035303 [Acer saccharum]
MNSSSAGNLLQFKKRLISYQEPREAVDLENITIEEVLENLKCTREKKESKLLNFWGLCGILCHGSWKLQLSWLLLLHMEGFIEENNAGNAAAALMARLAPKAKVLCDGRWSEEDAAGLVPGDIVSIKLGD